MKIIKGIAGSVGFFLPLLIGSSIETPRDMGLILIYFFSFGFTSKLLLQIFEGPFLNISSNTKAIDRHERFLDFISSFILFLAVGALVGELAFYQKIGAIPIILIVFGISIYLGTHYINKKGWFFNQ
ncbi:hypothetical protein [Algoriphagus sp. Y33]|uniref:hypothetical protein n=1 Tax=Algoriphagus sp. Y33 TaxID=2772483 RepID=UPI001781AE46|nr:hypothetical protein [Algoriphagus sp. Y33]